MEWTAGFPDRFRFLDQEHAEIGQMVAALKNGAGSGGEKNPALITKRLLKKIIAHVAHEVEVMKTYAYPERELHEKHHQHLIHSIELILQLFNTEGVAAHGAAIAKHIENRISEEMFVDRLLAKFLAEQDNRE